MSEILTAYKTIEEAPEAERQFLQEKDGSIVYVNDGLLNTIDAQRKAEREARAEAERYRNQLEAAKSESQKQAEKKEQEKEKEPQKSPKETELEKRLAVIEAEREREREENKRLRLENLKTAAAEQAGIHPEATKIFDSAFGLDESGQIFVKDSDGTPKINPRTGERLTAAEYMQETGKSKYPWIFKNQASSPGQPGGAAPKNQNLGTAGMIEQLKKQAEEARAAGNYITQLQIVRKLSKLGG